MRIRWCINMWKTIKLYFQLVFCAAFLLKIPSFCIFLLLLAPLFVAQNPKYLYWESKNSIKSYKEMYVVIIVSTVFHVKFRLNTLISMFFRQIRISSNHNVNSFIGFGLKIRFQWCINMWKSDKIWHIYWTMIPEPFCL